ncbi:endonuclease/exonuclease/phosphatase family protein [Actinoplanes sp. HUAS TT8]|uniref:endonuclease/exonuclease/phosphatase family protein n=1 Tax=Actinoplanes sp. HUAS TT8 TaxID=3447453 RepID=UPI003F528AC4
MNINRILSPVLAALTVAGVFLLARPAPSTSEATAAAAEPSIRVASWNICGEAGGAFGSSSYCPNRNEPDRKVDAVVNLVTSQQLNVVMLQEVCSGPLALNQAAGNTSLLDRLQSRLGDEWTTAWAEMQRPDGRSDCRGGLAGTLGVAIAVHGKISQITRRPLPVPHQARSSATGISSPTVLCAKVSGWTTEVCTTHLVNSDIGATAYADEVATLGTFVFDRPADAPQVVLGGDFNTRQWSTYLKTLHDKYDECDEKAYTTGDTVREPTIGGTDPGKIDYVFASAGFTACDVLTTGYQDTLTSPTPDGNSDHAPIVGYLK